MSSHYLWMIWLSLTNSISQQDPNTWYWYWGEVRALSGFPLTSLIWFQFILLEYVQCMLYAANSFRMQNSREAKQNGKQQETALLPLHPSYIWPRDQGLFYYWFKTSPETQANFSAWKMVVSLGSPIQSLIILRIQLQSGKIVFASYHCRNENLTPPKA